MASKDKKQAKSKADRNRSLAFTANGKNYVVSMSVNAICRLEEKLAPKGFPQMLSEMVNPDAITLSNVRLLFWAGLIDRQPETTIADAGELIMSVGGLNDALEMVMQAVTVSGIGGLVSAQAS